VAEMIHQMRAVKSYVAAHHSWCDENPDLSCPRCATEPETFQQAILTCPARPKDRDLTVKEVSSFGHDATL